VFRTSIISVSLFMIFAGSAAGICQVKQVCDDFGMNCEPEQICDSALDTPSVELPPLQPITLPTLNPLAPLSLPPLGTTQCEQRWICGNMNQCSWQNLCY